MDATFGGGLIYSLLMRMVKAGVRRILENEHYVGDEEYPAIIDKKTYSALLKQDAIFIENKLINDIIALF